ncbi:uncharacterized protein BDV17DRAFT_248564 [Aspergillus undulatus]|uniref:uncharacterized protein n=1 Tax=Aspergillus undulatus TaxID=1810928 RepID=UPI003CCD71FE
MVSTTKEGFLATLCLAASFRSRRGSPGRTARHHSTSTNQLQYSDPHGSSELHSSNSSSSPARGKRWVTNLKPSHCKTDRTL